MRRLVMTLLIVFICAGAVLVPVTVAQRTKHRSTHKVQPKSSSTPEDVCPSSGTAFEMSLSKMPIPNPSHHGIDDRCPRAGSSKPTTPHGAQNAAKNNFLAEGDPVELTFEDFTELQSLTNKRINAGEIKLDKIDKDHLPVNRTQLKMTVNGKLLSEGTLVTLEGLVYSAHYSNTKFNRYPQHKRGSGEANNCKCNRVDWNDIHIALVDDENDSECKSVTAEISPHYRSMLWSRFHDGQIDEIQAALPGLLKGKVVEGMNGVPIKIRVRGPLFYDASHQPCTFKSSGEVLRYGSPQRRSIWEVHPVYHIQVFDTAASKWMDLEEWAH